VDGQCPIQNIPSDKQIVAAYSAITGYNPKTGANDNGAQEIDVLNYWQSNAVDGDKVLAFVKIDPKNHTHIAQAIQLFGGVYLGFQVQQNCVQEFDAHQPWTPGPLTQDGHAVFAVGYDPNAVTVLTWGNTQQGTWGWWDECVDEAYAILPPEEQSDAANVCRVRFAAADKPPNLRSWML